MSQTTHESDEGDFSRYENELQLIDEVNCEGSGGSVLKKGPWTSAEDAILVDYVKRHGEGNWNAVQKHSGLFRCGKSCRLRWANHLRPNLKKGSFTQEEERLIIEVHAKIGNKWAHMAAHLPGRTDNEIKNYWNTRIKRRQRAGLPLYPPEVSLQALHDSQHGQNFCGIQSGDEEPRNELQTNSYEIPDVIFDSLKSNRVLPCVAELPAISSTGMLMKGLGSSQYYSFMPPTAHRPKRLRESPALFPSYTDSMKNGFPAVDHCQGGACDRSGQMFGLSFPLDPGFTSINPTNFGEIQGSHSLLNGNISASKPASEAVKLELPSLQYPETDLGSWGTSSSPPPLHESLDALIQSPSCETFNTDYLSPRNSGLLDALLLESKTLCSAKNQSSDKSCNSSTMTPGEIADSSTRNICDAEVKDYGDPISPLGHSATSLFCDYTHISGSRCSSDEQLPVETLTEYNVKSEVEIIGDPWTPDEDKDSITQFDFTWPDALLVSDWFEHSSGCVTADAAEIDLG